MNSNSKKEMLKYKLKAQKFTAIFENLKDAVYVYKLSDGKLDKFIEVNEEACSRLGYSKKELLNMKPEDIDSSKLRRKVFSNLLKELSPEGQMKFESTHVTKNGDEIPVEINSSLITINKQKFIVSIARDITLRKKYEKNINKLNKEYDIIFNNTQDSIFLIDISDNNKFKYQQLNHAHEKFIGITTTDVKGKSPIEIFGESIGKKINAKIKRCIDAGKTISYEEKFKFNKKTSYFNTQLSPVKRNNEIVKIVGVSRDITKEKEAQKKLQKEIKKNEYLSYHDQLTGLYNRRYFENKIEEFNKRGKNHKPISIIIIDIDELKTINDSFGHKEGDKYIKMSSDIINKSTREDDIIARIGGDEFAILLPDTDEDTAERIIKRIQKNVKEKNEDKQLKKDLSVSAGFSTQHS
ncbi:MAG: sensor domain-containing diguanylate cyclase, partial [bacterium]